MDAYEIAERHARRALAEIADHQMNAWTKHPSSESPKEIINRAIMDAIHDALTESGSLDR